jgi:ribosome-binding factor A
MNLRRPERLAEQIKEEVSLIIGGELEDPRIGVVTVTEARLSPDLKHAKIFVAVSGDESEISQSMKALNHAGAFIRRQLGGTLRMKHIPELHFTFDDTVRTAARIEELLSEEVKKAQTREGADDSVEN